MDSIPDDVLLIIFHWAYNCLRSRDFLNCFTVCRRWCDLAVPILYHDVVLHNRNISSFTAAISSSNASYVRSLTISIDAEPPAPPINHIDSAIYAGVAESESLKESAVTQRLWHQLSQLGPTLARMTVLTTFSLRVVSVGAFGFWLPRPLLAALVRQLSRTCVNLEIDTQGFDCRRPGVGHLCQEIQAVLPRLQHLRLRLAVMCCRIFGDGFTAHGTIEDELKFTPITAPVLRTVVINCDSNWGYENHSYVCDTFWEVPCGLYQTGLESREPLATCLRLLVSRGAFPMCRKLYLMEMQPYDSRDRATVAAYKQRDILNNITCSVPFHNIDSRRSRTCMVRTPGHVEVLGPSWEIAVVAEGSLWMTRNESIFPTEVRGAQRAENIRPDLYPPPLEDRVAFQKRLRVWILLWKWEDDLGQTLLRAIYREGLTDSTPLKLELPAGWRVSEEDGITLIMSQT